MFRQIVRPTPFTSEYADEVFSNITGSPWKDDYSFLSTLRALLAPRLKDGESVHLSFSSKAYNKRVIAENTVRDVMRAITEYIDLNKSGSFIITNFNDATSGDDNGNRVAMELIEANMTEFLPGYERLEKVTEFYKDRFHCLCFINRELKSCNFFVENLDFAKLHFLQVSILAIPWFLNPEEGITDLERTLVRSLGARSAEDYSRAISELSKLYDFREARIKRQLRGFELRFLRREAENINSKIEDISLKIRRSNAQIGQWLDERNELNIRLYGLTQKTEASETNEIMEYFLMNPRLELEAVSDTSISFYAKDYLAYFDKDFAERIIDNPNSFCYKRNGRSYQSIPANKMKKLLRAIFIDEVLKIRFCAAYRFHINGNVEAMSGHEFGEDNSSYMPNPHIDRYSCMGNYQQAINTLLEENQYVLALEQCVASAKSLNFADTTVMSCFMDIMYHENNEYRNNTAIELPDGRVVAPADAIVWLENEETHEEKTTEEIPNE